MVALQDLASPVAAFVRDRCVRGPVHEVAVDTLYTAWKAWAEDNGHVKSTKQVFGRDLRAAVPGLRVARPGGHDELGRARVYVGVTLREGDPT
jgi:putative DNA primase/helicase